jgi:hypothetical protein
MSPQRFVPRRLAILIVVLCAIIAFAIVNSATRRVSSELFVHIGGRVARTLSSLAASLSQLPTCETAHETGILQAQYDNAGKVSGWECDLSAETCYANPQGVWQTCTYPPTHHHPWPSPVPSPLIADPPKPAVTLGDGLTGEDD